MNIKAVAAIITGVSLFCAVFFLAYAQEAFSRPPDAQVMQTRTVDVNKDGKPDVTYYLDGKNVSRIEADTNYDGKPDVVVQAENGRFKSAEVDTNYDGKPEKKFNNAKEFNQWLNKNNPKFKDTLGWRDDGTYTLFMF